MQTFRGRIAINISILLYKLKLVSSFFSAKLLNINRPRQAPLRDHTNCFGRHFTEDREEYSTRTNLPRRIDTFSFSLKLLYVNRLRTISFLLVPSPAPQIFWFQKKVLTKDKRRASDRILFQIVSQNQTEKVTNRKVPVSTFASVPAPQIFWCQKKF